MARVLRPGGLFVHDVLQPLLPAEGRSAAGWPTTTAVAWPSSMPTSSRVGGFERADARPIATRVLRGDPLYAAWAPRRARMTGAEASWRRLEADVVGCRACPRLVAWREQVAAREAGGVP